MRLSPAVGSNGLQLWRVLAADGGQLVPGTTIFLQSVARTGCGAYIGTSSNLWDGDRQRVELWPGKQWPATRWVLHAGPAPHTIMLESEEAPGFWSRRWLGAPRACAANELGLFAATDPGASVVWKVLPT